LLTSDFSFDVVAAASMLGPAGAVPTGLTGVIEVAVSDIFGFLGLDKSSFLHAINKIVIHATQSKAIGFFMINSSILLEYAFNVLNID
jgi:hypothetical protein